ncbi:hypothetical protein K0U91_06715 [Chryseobacterium chendengshani]|uniref:hypothetical protein n=1 Tax=Chryseobacterium sp. LJ668 TaxID=2864040 RepID=UPI001C689D35|nr:hypothetical protein [Chryseobacterium sp. LJ668]MBW8522158.1 hypothetical protein [Chryseobacterium sp. LJ668]QYK17805.1 hypothetical protein K0U91_06715 [Chryseobacterium sp. LJ668]
MNINASKFIRNRRDKIALTQKRINDILICVINSYDKIIADKVVFDLSQKNIGSIKKEDYLRNRLVDDYLQNELSILEDGTDRFTINKETAEEYRSLVDEKLHNDPIDIHIVDKAQKDSWGKNTKPYFAIECKRINSGFSEYIEDTQKFTERNYPKLRLPFEGQLGFIENSSYSYELVYQKINKNLSSNTKIETTKSLQPHILIDKYDGSYISSHRKKDKSNFSVFHIFFDYSKIIIN